MILLLRKESEKFLLQQDREICKTVSEQHTENTALNVHKCEIFDLLDFCDFYTIKSLWVCDFGAKMYIVFI